MMSARILQVRGPARAATATPRCCTASTSRSTRAASPRSWAPTAPARPPRCARCAAWSRRRARSCWPATRIDGKRDREHRAPGRRPCARRPRHLPQPHRRGKPAPRRLHARATATRSQADFERMYGYFPAPEGAPAPAGRHAVGRRAADAGGGARADAPAAAAAAGRALVRPGAADRAGDSSRSCARSTRADGSACCWWSRTPRWRCDLADHAYLLETGRVVISGTAEAIRNDESVRRSYLGTEGARMDLLHPPVLSGLATGGIYASLALALVMIYQATHLVNFAQGEMAMFATYLAWTLIQAGMPYWGAFFAHGGDRLRRRRRHRARDRSGRWRTRRSCRS